jgi:cysteine/histidine-rich domain-containing protein
LKDACQFHPGVPVFHDALKGWSCCNKKSTDFTQFLSIPGCTVASHTNEKPVEPEKPVKEEPVKKDEVLVYETAKMPEPTARPTNNEPLAEMKRTVAPNLFVILEKLTASLTTVALGLL